MDAWTICTYISLTTCPLRLHRTLRAGRKFLISVSNFSVCVKDGGAEKRRGRGEREIHNASESQLFWPSMWTPGQRAETGKRARSWTQRQKKSVIMHCTNLLLSEYEQISQLTAQQYLTPLLLQQIPTPIGSIMIHQKTTLALRDTVQRRQKSDLPLCSDGVSKYRLQQG